MKIMNRKRVLSFLLSLAMFVSLIPSSAFTIFAADEVGSSSTSTESESAKNEFEANVGKQAIIDVGCYFVGVYVGDEDYAKGNDDGIIDEFDYDPFSIESHRFVAIVEDYCYNTRGEHWYKLAPREGEEDRFPLSNPWVFHTSDEDIADNAEPALIFYGEDETVRFEESSLQLAGEAEPKTVLFVVAGPAALKDAVVDIQHIVVDEENPRTYPVSPLAFTEPINNSTFSKAYSFYIGKPVDGSVDENGELITTPWTAADGTISVRYDSDHMGLDTYFDVAYDENGNIIYDDNGIPEQGEEIYIDYGAAFMYADGNLFSADIMNMVEELSDIVYTNSGNSTLVFEHMPESTIGIGATGYFTEETIPLFTCDLVTSKEFAAADLPKSVTVEASFTKEVFTTDDQGNTVSNGFVDMYWITMEGFGEKQYFLVPVEYISFMDPSVPQLTGMLRLKVRFVPEYQNEEAIVDFLYETPGYKATALTDVYARDLPTVMKIVDTYYTSEDDVYFLLEDDNGEWWPGEYGNHRWVSANLLELVSISYTEMAPFGPPVVGQSMAVFARTAVRLAEVEQIAEDLDSNGVVTKKVVTPTGTPGEYTVTLEAYVTGQKTTVTITEEVATDIILVLDQSGSMSTNDFKTITGYQLTNGRASNCVNKDIYVKDGDVYVKVTVKTNYSYTSYTTSNRTNENYYDHAQLYYQVDGEYYPVEVERGGSGTGNNRYYDYYYLIGNNRYQIGTRQYGYSTTPNTTVYNFYTRSNTASGYTFSYVDANGVTQSETFGTNANITTNKYYTATTRTITRLQALQNAVTAFAESVHEKAKGKDGQLGTDDDVNHRIAVVGFAHCYNNSYRYTNTELFVGSTQYGYNNYSQNDQNNANSAQSHYDDAFQNMNTTAGYNNVIASKNALAAEGGTYVDLGIEMANGIFAANPVEAGTKRNRVVIVFTDGDPGYSGEWEGNSYGISGDAEAVANRAIVNATTSKNTYGATVYSIGVFNGADAETRPVSSVSNGNQFMHYVSSNYTGGSSFDSPGTASFPVKGSYYLSANNTEDLTGIFQQISQNVEGGGASMTLDETTVVRDIVSPNFVVPSGTTGIKYFTSQYTGPDTWATRVEEAGVSAIERKSNGTTTLDITGFDFSENYVGTETKDGEVTGYRGKKLIIEFTIQQDPDFLGGSNVDTNGALSGIYTGDGNPVEYFTQPKVDVTLKEISTVVQNKYIYYGNTVNLTDILNLYVKRDDQNTDLRITVDGVNNAYVDLQYTITLNDSTVAIYTIPAGKAWDKGTWTKNQGELLQNFAATGETSFTVNCVMTDAGDSSKSSPASGTAYVFVYKPTLTFMDSVQEYNKPITPTADDVNSFLSGHYVGVQWNLEASPNRPADYADYAIDGTEPTFTFTFNDVGNAFEGMVMKSVRDVPIVVTVTVHGTEAYGGNATSVTGNTYITFAHQDCDPDCGFDPSTEQFIVHVIGALTSLTIQKSGWYIADPNQTFLFNITGKDADGNNIDLTVTVHEDGSVTIYGLVIGNTYTITEDVNWSWRYNCTGWEYSDGTAGSGNEASITIVENGTITFTNSRNVDKWLDGDAWCDNLFNLVTTVKDDEE